MVLVVTTTVPSRVYRAVKRVASGLGLTMSETVLRIAHKSSEFGRLPVTIEDLEDDAVFKAAKKVAKSERRTSMKEFVERMGGQLQRHRRPAGSGVSRIKIENRPNEGWQVESMALLARMAWEYQSASRAVMWVLAGILEVAKRAGVNGAIRLELEELIARTGARRA